jgi:hypothetical protein
MSDLSVNSDGRRSLIKTRYNQYITGNRIMCALQPICGITRHTDAFIDGFIDFD